MTISILTAAPGTFHVNDPSTTHAIYGETLSDGIKMNYGVPAVARCYTLNGGGIGIAPTQTATWQPTAIVAELINMHASDAELLKYGVVLTDQIIMQAALQAGWPITVSGGGIGTHDAMTVIRGLVLAEKLGLGSTLAPTTKYGITVAEQLKLHDGLFRFFSGTLTDGLGFHDGLTTLFQPTARITDVINIHDTQAAKLVFGMEIDEHVQLTHTQVLKMIFQGDHLLDGVQLRALHVLPNGTYTTWAINTRTGAVTEYSNYVFNSFCRMGNHYLGANDKGIWVLDDARDNGANIIADLKSGKMQLGGSKFTSFRSAYLGLTVRDDDGQTFLLKMVAGDGSEFVYAVKPQPNGTTTKVNMGKGLRSRYFSFELISQGGADFDLDSIEFVPIISQRRV